MDKNANAMTEDLNMSDSEGTNVQGELFYLTSITLIIAK